MSAFPFSKFDLTKLGTPTAIDEIAFDAILLEITEKFKLDNPDLSDALDFESEPLTALLQAWAYREYIFRQYINNSLKAGMLAFSTGTNLDHLAALVPLQRLDGETDDDFRQRIQLAPEGFSTAGPVGAYEFHAQSVSGKILDIYVDTPTPGVVHVYVMEDIAAAPISAQLILDVGAALNQDEIRPLTDQVTVLPAEIVNYDVTAALTLGAGQDAISILASAEASLTAYVQNRRKFGQNISRSGLLAALHVGGVENVDLTAPSNGVALTQTQVALAGTLTVTEVAHA
ncbi:MAG: baseplate J/gp47 family protein [Robiginitomaculum sp.]|nr:baseplate J/gp47 family protein [Robiginitomaculum sp.]